MTLTSCWLAGTIGVHQLFRNIDLVHLVDQGDDPIETRIGEATVFSEAFNEAPARRPDDPYARN
jgi:hypothetical protein